MTPDWVFQVMWWGAGILGGGAVFYFLQINAPHSALWTGFGTGVVVLLAITLNIRNGIVGRERDAATATQRDVIGPTAAKEQNAQMLAPESRFIRDSILALVHELRLASGKQFRTECSLLPGEQLGPEKPPMALLALASGKFTIVKSLHQLSSAFAGVEGGFLFTHDSKLGGRVVKPGYERLVDEYQSLLGKSWVIAADRYRDGVPLTGNETFNICAYGLRPIDETAISALLAALAAAERN